MKPAAIVLLAAIAAVVAAPLARGGGDFADLAVAGARVWFVGGPGVRELEARTGHTIASPQLIGAASPLSVALAGGAAWVASVEGGYVWGTLTRIDARTGKARVLSRRYANSIEYVAAGAGGVWVLIGSPSAPTRTRIARFSLSGRLSRSWSVPDAGRIAADQSGCWISTDHWLLHIDVSGRIHHVVRARLGDVATGAGAVWLPQAASVLRIDEQTGQIRTLHTGRLHLGGFQHDLAVGDGSLWALDGGGRSHSTVERYDLRSGRRTDHADVPGIADAVIVTPNAVWVASVAGYELIRLDPRTLHRSLVVHVE